MRTSSLVLPLSLALAAAACSFPDVEYADGGAGGGSSCPAMDSCTNPAAACAEKARTDLDCVHKCKTPDSMACIQCKGDLQIALDACAATCTSCFAKSCSSSAEAPCRNAVGTP